ncbi:hypothetical protein [Micromonospora sp. CB01531]|uniref:hypothetical protein n=1 Tax=Micromonospora sp. CB01531 TaxID=1718947 RepID=UPI00093DF19D|nr:hypothetical protein [Micromonospora sp. CB01531]OKI54566.1 hypothetical protein A6A27_32075 [Micromonospora sp. CB01531]
MNKVLAGLIVVLGVALAVIGIIGLEAWLVMLFLGVLHLHLTAAIPALSFVQTFLAVIVVNSIAAWLRSIFQPKKETSK